MYKAITKRKVDTERGVRVDVDFVYGEKVISEFCWPQDKDGFDHWVMSRLAAHNFGLQNNLVDGEEIVITKDVQEPIVPTKAEIDRNTWLEKYHKWVRIKTTLIDTGVIPDNNAQVVAFLDAVKADFKPAYINFI